MSRGYLTKNGLLRSFKLRKRLPQLSSFKDINVGNRATSVIDKTSCPLLRVNRTCREPLAKLTFEPLQTQCLRSTRVLHRVRSIGSGHDALRNYLCIGHRYSISGYRSRPTSPLRLDSIVHITFRLTSRAKLATASNEESPLGAYHRGRKLRSEDANSDRV